MNKRIIYPGEIRGKEIILITGSVYGADISSFICSLAEGVRADGLSVTVASPGLGRCHCEADQVGNPDDWDLNYDVVLIDYGEYIDEQRFRHGFMDSFDFTRTIFITHVAENSISSSVLLPHETQARKEVSDYVSEHLPNPVHLARPSLSRMSSGERMISETNNEILLAMESGEDPDPTLLEKRQEWKSVRILDRMPQLEKRLW